MFERFVGILGFLVARSASPRKAAIIACGFAACLFTQTAVAETLEGGVAAYKGGDYRTALKILRPLALQGNIVAQHNLGIMYENGLGVPQDFAEAVKLYRLVAERGIQSAQFNLGNMYRRGLGVPQDFAEAAKWYRLAADQGDAYAQSNLGLMYKNGQGVIMDYAETVRLFRLSANQGNPAGQFNLAIMFARGDGGPKDIVQAHMWLSLAVKGYGTSNTKGRDEAMDILNIITKYMDVAQIAEAERLVHEWLAAHPTK